jgi:rhodanese-related sulfurtransferase
MNNLTQQEWWDGAQQGSDAVILDVRTPEEWAQGIIPGAITLDFYRGDDFIEELEQLDKTKSYYVYCRSGARSGNSCGILQQLGFEKAFNLNGGIMQWQGPIAEFEG